MEPVKFYSQSNEPLVRRGSKMIDCEMLPCIYGAMMQALCRDVSELRRSSLFQFVLERLG